MKRALLLLLFAALALAGCNAKDKGGDADPTPTPSPAAPPPPPPPPTAGSFHVNASDTWLYRGGTAEEPEEVLVRVIAANESVVRFRTTTTALRNNSSTNTVTSVDAQTFAVMVLEDGRLGATLRFDPPLNVYIPAADHTYTGTVSVPTSFGDLKQPATGNVTFLGLENVTVPAGTFESYHYEAHFRTEGFLPFEQNVEVWFAPKLDQAVKTITDGRLQELLEVTRG